MDYISNLPISQTKIYSILAIINLLDEHFELKVSERSETFLIEDSNNKLTIDYNMLNNKFDPIHKIGLSKLELALRIKNVKIKRELINSLIAVKESSVREIIKIKDKANKKLLSQRLNSGLGVKDPERFTFKIKGDTVLIGDKPAFNLLSELDSELRKDKTECEEKYCKILQAENIPVFLEAQDMAEARITEQAIKKYKSGK